jgi:hypothetical protein
VVIVILSLCCNWVYWLVWSSRLFSLLSPRAIPVQDSTGQYSIVQCNATLGLVSCKRYALPSLAHSSESTAVGEAGKHSPLKGVPWVLYRRTKDQALAPAQERRLA